jgi:uncharacterized protein YqeY
MINEINEQLKNAMRNNDTNKKATLRMLKANITLKSKELMIPEDQLDNNVILSSIEKVLKIYREELESVHKYAPDEAKINNLNESILFLESFLPEQLTTEQVIAIVNSAVEEMSNFGLIMKYLSKELKGKADMKMVKQLVDITIKEKK